MTIGIIEAEGFPQEALIALSKLGEVIASPSLVLQRAGEVKGLFCRLNVFLGEEYLSQFSNLDWIASPTTALSHIDSVYVDKRQIRVYSLRDLAPERLQRLTSTAELTVFLTLAITRNYLHLATFSNVFSGWDRYAYPSEQLTSKTIGIIGVGRIGARVYNTLGALGAKVVGFDLKDVSTQLFRPVLLPNLDAVLEMSDVLILCASYQSGQAPILGAEELCRVRSGVKLVNTARGELVDEHAIAELLRSGVIAGYACDVIAGEPSERFRQSPILEVLKEGGNVILTPHIGGASSDSISFCEAALAQHVVARQSMGTQ